MHRSQVDLRLMRVEHFDLALRHHPQNLLLRLCHDRPRHQRESQRKHRGSEPIPRPDRHGTLLRIGVLIGSIVNREGGYAFDSWKSTEGLVRGYAYWCIEDEHYARNVEIRVPCSERSVRAVIWTIKWLNAVRGARWTFSAEALPTSTAACSAHQTTALRSLATPRIRRGREPDTD